MDKTKILLSEATHYSLLERIQFLIFELITEHKGIKPDTQQVRDFILEHFRTNMGVGRMFTTILSTQYYDIVDFTDLKETINAQQLLDKLYNEPFQTPVFIEIRNFPDISPEPLGVVIDKHLLNDGGYVYMIFSVIEDLFPKQLAGHFKIYTVAQNEESIFSILTSNGSYEFFNASNWSNSATLSFILRVLDCFDRQNPRIYHLHASEVHRLTKDSPSLEPPDDARFSKLINRVLIGKTYCTYARVPLESIQPHSLDFCLSYPIEIIDFYVRLLKKEEKRIIIYWNGKSFIMSDDYPLYLAYRKLESKYVPTSIMGDFPQSIVQAIEKVGGAELVPPVHFHYSKDPHNLPDALKKHLLDNRLKPKNLPDAREKIDCLFIGLARLVQNQKTTERQLHEFLLANPIILDSHGMYVMSEVRLGNMYRIDLVIQYETSAKRICLVELERANIKIFTKSGRPRAKITHAIQQVEDWLRWWQENPDKVPAPLDKTLSPEGLIVVGRSTFMSDDEKQRLLHLNQNRRVKTITYDDLLNQIKNLGLNLEKL